ncbi:MAG: glycosyltransferase family 4 protein [Burkholderiaceae bacterium]|nr:glycosyltransferase family 4 protein [Burkholderiaceae bacterium]
MKIALTSHAFYPAVGGIETMSLLLAYEFIRRGHQVTVVTHTMNPDQDDFPFKVIRAPSPLALYEVSQWCDVYFQNNVSLQMLWPLIFVRRPWIVRHATWISRMDGSLSWQDKAKRYLLKFSTGISNSHAIAAHLPVQTTIIGNPYRDEIFRVIPGVERDLDLVFLGRLVSDKGAAILLDAVHDLRNKGLRPTVTIIGDGPELPQLRLKVETHALQAQVVFAGPRTGQDLVELLNRHRIMVVPSIWKEPFGIVALEGIACGCAVIGSSGGGLKDAIGPCGLTFDNGDIHGLGIALGSLLSDPGAMQPLLDAAPEHLARHTTRHVVDRYLEVIACAMDNKVDETE